MWPSNTKHCTTGPQHSATIICQYDTPCGASQNRAGAFTHGSALRTQPDRQRANCFQSSRFRHFMATGSSFQMYTWIPHGTPKKRTLITFIFYLIRYPAVSSKKNALRTQAPLRNIQKDLARTGYVKITPFGKSCLLGEVITITFFYDNMILHKDHAPAPYHEKIVEAALCLDKQNGPL